MRRLLIAVAMLLFILAFPMLVMSGCDSSDIVSFGGPRYDRAMIEMPGGEVIDVYIDGWTYPSGQQQLIINTTDGRCYLVHTSKCILIEDE